MTCRHVRLGFVQYLNEERSGRGLQPLTEPEEEAVAAASVDLVFDFEQYGAVFNPV
jgi:hypothetical protein